MTGFSISEEDKVLIEKFIKIRNSGYYCDSKQLTEVYNRVLGKNVASTQCSSCLRGRVTELEKALTAYLKAQESVKITEADNVSAEPEKVSEKPKKQPKNGVRQKTLSPEKER